MNPPESADSPGNPEYLGSLGSSDEPGTPVFPANYETGTPFPPVPEKREPPKTAAHNLSSLREPVRLHSLDALRGFDMFWIIGGAGLVHALTAYFDWPLLHTINDQLHHVEWDGFTFYDMIFPLFLFIAGVAMPFSLTKRLARGEDKRKLMRHVIQRGLVLVVLGIIMNNGLFQTVFSEMRFPSVLGRIGLAYMFAGLIVLNTRLWGQVLWFGGLLLGYWALMMWLPLPGHVAGSLTMEGSLAGYLDSRLIPGRLYKGVHDPEGLLATLPAIGTALLGALTGLFLSPESRRLEPWMKAVCLALAGTALLWLGKFWDPLFPINKNLWSSSFVVYVGGWSLLLLSIFYLVIDVFGCKKWALFFTVIGLNPILIYMAPKFINFGYTADAFFGGFAGFFPGLQPVLMVIATLAIKWLLLYFLYRKKVFLRI
jgi:predicted acyltransferase